MITSAFPDKKCYLTGYDPNEKILKIFSAEIYQNLTKNFSEIYKNKYNLIFVHMVLGGLPLGEVKEVIFKLVNMLKIEGAIFIVESIIPNGFYEHNLWKARKIEIYTPLFENFSWEIIDEFNEAGSTLKIIVGRFN